MRRLAEQIEGDTSCHVAALYIEQDPKPIYSGVHVIEGVLEPIVINFSPKVLSLKVHIHFEDGNSDQAA